MEISLNVFTEFAANQPPLVLEFGMLPQCQQDRNFKLNPIHASVIISFPEFAEFSESYAPFRNNSIEECGSKDVTLTVQPLPGLLLHMRSTTQNKL